MQDAICKMQFARCNLFLLYSQQGGPKKQKYLKFNLGILKSKGIVLIFQKCVNYKQLLDLIWNMPNKIKLLKFLNANMPILMQNALLDVSLMGVTFILAIFNANKISWECLDVLKRFPLIQMFSHLSYFSTNLNFVVTDNW